MVKKCPFTLILFFCFIFARGQNTAVKGVVIDSISQMPLPYAAVYFGGTTTATLCDNAGRFSISIPNDADPVRSIVFALSGYRFKQMVVAGGKTSDMTVQLQPLDFQERIDAFGRKWKSKELYKLLYKATKIVSDDYVAMGNPRTNKFDFGRIQTAVSYNYLEGIRLRGGFASTARLHPHLFVKGYAAYGFRDQRMKYRGETAWAFNRPKYHEGEFPANNLRLVHEYDVYSLGEIHPHSQNDELLYSFRHAKGSLAYRRFTEINYEKENYPGFSYIVWINKRSLVPAGQLVFRENETGKAMPDLNTTETGIRFRFSPWEAFRQNRRKKIPQRTDSPIFSFSCSLGLKKVLGGEYGYQRTEFSAQKRFLLGTFGHIDAMAEAQRVWTKVPFPLLLYPNANPSYIIDNESFSLLNAMEFITDSQYILKTTYVANNLLLARIPYLEALSLREVFSIRGVYGQLSEKNNPSANPGLLQFPQQSGVMKRGTPYWEAGFGIANIAGVLRVDYVFRLTYRQTPGALKNGFRIGISL